MTLQNLETLHWI